jgi:hypothetical protein
MRLHEIGEVRVRKLLTNAFNRRRRKDDIADLSKPDEKDALDAAYPGWCGTR